MSENDIAVVGMSCVFPGALNLDQYWSNVVNGVNSITKPPADRSSRILNFEEPLVPCLKRVCRSVIFGGFIPSELRVDPLRYGVLPKNVLDGDPDQFLAVAVIDAALRDAGCNETDPLRERCDVIIGRGGYMTNKMAEGYLNVEMFPHLLLYLRQQFPEWSEGQFSDFAQRMFERMPPDSGADSTTTCMPNLVASRAANRLNLRGAAYCVDAACASSLLSVEHAVMRLRAGLSDIAVAGGLHLVQQPSFWGVFHQMGALSKSNVLRPFDRRADGLLIGEGAGAVTLKRWEDARRDGDRVYAVLKGIASSSDGRGAAILNPLSAGQVLALKRAYQDAQLDPASIGYLEAHGTGTEIGDAVEIHTLKTFFGETNSAAPTKALGSVKSMIGHLMPAAGIASFIRTALALSNKILPPSLNCEEPHPALNNSNFYVNNRSRAWVHQRNGAQRRAGINAFGFGGINVHAILEEVPEEAPISWSRPFHCPADRKTELFAWASSAPDQLVAELKQMSLAIENKCKPTLAELSAAALRSVDLSRSCKLALLSSDLEDLGSKLATCIAKLEQGETDFTLTNDIFYATAAAQAPGRVAAVFPGMNYPGLGGASAEHLITLSLHFPELRRRFDKIEKRDENPDDAVPTSMLFSPPETLPEETRAALRNRISTPQLSEMRIGAAEIPASKRNIAIGALAIANRVGWEMLQALDVKVDCVVGQSLGDLGATCAAGIVDLDHVMPGFWIAMATAPPYLGDGQLACVFASEEQLAPWLADAPQTQIAVHISPRVQVLGGPAGQLEKLVKSFIAEGIIAQMLPYPPMHTPECGYLDDVMSRGMAAGYTHFHEARLQVYSCVTASEYPREKQQIRGMVVEMLNKPVRYWQTLRRMYEDGVRVYIEASNGGLVEAKRSTLPDTQAVVACLEQETIEPLTQLNRLCATLFTSGVTLDLNRLHTHRKLRMLDLKEDSLGVPSEKPGMMLPLRMAIFPFGKEILEIGPGTLPAPKTNANGAAHAATGAGQKPAIAQPIAETSKPFAVAPSPAHAVPTVAAAEETQSPEMAPHENSAGSTEQQVGIDALGIPHRPFQGEIKEFVPGERIVIERLLDLDRDLFVNDHAFVPVQEYKPVEACMPLFPMAAMVEVLAEAAEFLAPGLGVIGVEQMQALRWIAFRNQKTVLIRVESRVESVDQQSGVVTVRSEVFSHGESNASAQVLLGAAYEERLQIDLSPRDGSRPWIYTHEEIYRDRHAFHGPRLQCLTNTGATGARGGDGGVTILPVDDWFIDDPNPQLIFDIATLDGTAQAVGGWVRSFGKFSVPLGFDKLELYQGTPPIGTEVKVRVELIKGDASSRIYALDFEVENGQGQVWMRCKGFRVWAFEWDIRAIDAIRQPDKVFYSDRIELAGLPKDFVLARVGGEHVPNGNLDWLGIACMTRREIECFDQLESPRRKRQWFFGRTAAKDAVRMWMKQQHGIEFLHPLSFAILNDEQGCPYVEMLYDLPDPPYITITHAGEHSFAAAAACPIGIDAEPGDRSVEEILPHFTSDEESHVLKAFDESANGPLRLWCAKEAVGKVRGTGLAGAPKHFEAIDLEADGRLLVQHHPSADRYMVTTDVVDGIVLAYVVSEPSEAALIDAVDAHTNPSHMYS